ncbi:4-(cytidine 5'-diphospho)-2-C-methyl-D-erythritol kinase [Aliidiomarina iranensis]|uniref:4-diphosphocytidyl-2-C-methyl-D-erythritol kinase n=1 Tax=Aliidiomarina iranensis TaxID=1434071 RepID=A0A432VX38_9GAMM|nr:4-(cytidine 5'-diphospho)-2-C-methyl-D-erythritol kinase [Aliidiomarina iranensis]RUO21227.1 4-(cytidine 5'-diphospho)-2-C-methyl-D-erythritol kinase [Aliidiomarina iranensis]
MAAFSLPAPAKLNLYLHIIGQRADGYHELETLFQFLNYSDEIQFELTANGEIELDQGGLNFPITENLIYRAANLLLPFRNDPQQGARLKLIKQLPAGGGLGGGSSDAATTLLGLNHLWQLGLTQQQLANIGLRLGADVPVFIHGHATFAQGVGEIFSPANPAENWYLIVQPEVHVSTAEVFSHPALTRNTPALEKALNEWEQGHNDCEKLVCSLYPQVASALQWLLKYALSRMTGTGACVFGCFSSAVEAEQALQVLPTEFRGFVAKGVNQSPLHQALKQLP